jgi:hypothetical protein
LGFKPDLGLIRVDPCLLCLYPCDGFKVFIL